MKNSIIAFAIVVFIGTASAWAERLTVATSKANIRSGPGTEYDIIWKVEKFHPLSIIDKSDAWYFFRDFEKDEGWIHKSLLKNIPAVITRTDKCNIRSGPGIKYDILYKVGKGIPFKVLQEKKNWLHIEHADGDKGWLHKSLVW
ncbi:MAG: SH3 domain-containing protein [Deltaproteobacteria bacterium]|nr:SH3 domain-containing protein [Deltaproteobacteria bacterium]